MSANGWDERMNGQTAKRSGLAAAGLTAAAGVFASRLAGGTVGTF